MKAPTPRILPTLTIEEKNSLQALRINARITNFMKKIFPLLAIVSMALVVAGCSTIKPLRAPYEVTAYKPKNPANVKVKVSLQNRAVYVMEGDKPLLVTATAIGLPTNPTPKGHFKVFNKIANKRSNSYGFWVRGNDIVAAKSSQRPAGTGWNYVGFPMQWWVEFHPAYGFHVGSVWPTPRTHGCLRLHENAARQFYDLTRLGTPVYIAETQPEDATIGRDIKRPHDYNDPDPHPSFTISPAVFKIRPGTELKANPY